MKTVLEFESHPDRKLHVWFFTDVKNAKEIGTKILERKLPRDYAFINARWVPDLFIIHLCASKALFAESSDALRCKKLHGELIVNLSGSKHIAASLKKYGASDDVEHFLVAGFDASEADEEFVIDFVEGILTPIEQLQEFADTTQICKVSQVRVLLVDRVCASKSMKISQAELSIGSLVDAVSCRVAAHDLDKV